MRQLPAPCLPLLPACLWLAGILTVPSPTYHCVPGTILSRSPFCHPRAPRPPGQPPRKTALSWPQQGSPIPTLQAQLPQSSLLLPRTSCCRVRPPSSPSPSTLAESPRPSYQLQSRPLTTGALWGELLWGLTVPDIVGPFSQSPRDRALRLPG